FFLHFIYYNTHKTCILVVYILVAFTVRPVSYIAFEKYLDFSEKMPSATSPAPFPVKKRDILHSDNTRYLIMDFNGEGYFGKVAQCFNLIMAKMVAIKIPKESDDPTIQREVGMLEAVSACDPDKKNILRFMENFRFSNLSCLVFEMLDRSLWDLVEERKWEPLSVSEIRPVTHQLLFAFEPLKNIGLMHTDLKPDNIMLVNHKDQPFKIKLIDFGMARPASKAKILMITQASAYRAPEVTLGLPLSECAVDIWTLGCMLAIMVFGFILFPRRIQYDTVESETTETLKLHQCCKLCFSVQVVQSCTNPSSLVLSD
uniref:Protein kinase domain-containing protein n=1 Tax=Seriola lalandi dorsalis TaxID=1841481 RepID=A0A3B4Z0J0_SERLL